MSKLLSVSKFRDEPFPFNDDQEAFIKELETTDKAQCDGLLAFKNTYCCLGVACVLFGAERKPSSHGKKGDAFIYGGASDDRFLLPNALAHRLRMRSKGGGFASSIRVEGVKYNDLTGLNDHMIFPPGQKLIPEHKFTFKDIAAYIRHDPWNVFMGPDEKYQNYEGIPLS